MEFTDEERDKYEQELEDTDVKALLIDIASTNRAILQQLYAINRTLSEPAENEENSAYKCLDCGEIVHKDERQKHAQQSHNAPSSIAVEELGLFEPA